MTDLEFIDALESGELLPEQFNHAAHIRAACIYLRHQPFLDAAVSMRNALQAFAARIGKDGLYHETLTVALMSIVADRLERFEGNDWQAFLMANPDLSERTLLNSYYRPETLGSDRARQRLVLERYGE